MKQHGEREEKQSAIRYVCVSHPDQVEDGISLDAQAARIAAYCTMSLEKFLSAEAFVFLGPTKP